MDIPEKITVDATLLKKKAGRPTTIAARRKSTPVKGKVKGKRNHFTDKEKLNAACVFAVSGNSRRTAELTKIPEATIRSWKQTAWWNEAMQRIIVEQDEELGTDLTKLINKAVVAIEDRIENGDSVYDSKRGTLVRKPVSAKDLAVVSAITIDKRQLLRGQPTERVEKISVDDTLKTLQDEFRKFSKAKEIKQEVEPLPEEPVVVEADWEEEFEEETVNEMFGEA